MGFNVKKQIRLNMLKTLEKRFELFRTSVTKEIQKAGLDTESLSFSVSEDEFIASYNPLTLGDTFNESKSFQVRENPFWDNRDCFVNHELKEKSCVLYLSNIKDNLDKVLKDYKII